MLVNGKQEYYCTNDTDIILMEIQMYIQKVKFVHILRKCEMLLGARKIIQKSLFIRIIRFRGVFLYPVDFSKEKF